jgi:phospholipid/cholesterol/gamma-HCH transport system permease protein
MHASAQTLPRELPVGGRTGPRRGAAVLEHVGRVALLAWAILQAMRQPRVWARLAIDEARRQALDLLPLAILLALLGGALIAQQTGYQFQGTLPAWVVGSIVAASLVTELTPLFTGFALVGIVGTRIAAELGAMVVTEQVDALEVMGRNPVAYLVVPRVLAGLIATPVVVTFALAASMLAGWGTALLVTRAGSPDFWFGVRQYMTDFPIFFATIKAAVFGLSTTFIACYVGLEAHGGSRGVGRAARQGVVAMITAVVLLDTALVPLLGLAD